MDEKKRRSGGESGGGAYPNPHSGKDGEGKSGGFLGHGGQSDMAYHGEGQLGDEVLEGNPNAPARNEADDENEGRSRKD